MKNHTLAFIDIETTGLLVEKHEIIEIGCVLVRQNPFEIIDEFDIKIIPKKLYDADPVALKINGYNENDWADACPLKKGLEILSEKTNGAIMVAHNVAFDWAFLNKAFKDTEVANKMSYQKLDTISIAFAKLNGNSDIKKFSLSALCKHFNIENKKAHTALSDAKAMYELYEKLMG